MFGTVHRKAGSIHCTAQGLEPEKVKTLTKHKMEIFQKSYMCEMSTPVLTTLAGFNPINPHDGYFVARTTIGLPGDLSPSELSTILFPHLARWKNEIASEGGDKSEGAHVFLTSVLPFLAEVIVQDGIFWIDRYPDNPAVQEFLRLIDGKTGDEHYTFWARRMRKKVKDIYAERKVEKTQAKDLFKSLAASIEKSDALSSRMEQSIQKSEMLNSKMEQAIANFENLSQPLQLANGAPAAVTVAPLAASVPLALPAPSETSHSRQNVTTTLDQHQSGHSRPRALPTNMGTMLRLGNNPRKPIINAVSFYKTVEKLMGYFHIHHHNLVKKRMASADWQNAKEDPNRWSQIKKIYARVEDRLDELGMTHSQENKVQAAKWLDENEKKEKTLHQYVAFLRRREGAVGTRRRGD